MCHLIGTAMDVVPVASGGSIEKTWLRVCYAGLDNLEWDRATAERCIAGPQQFSNSPQLGLSFRSH